MKISRSACLVQGQKNRYFIWAKWSTALHAVTFHTASSIALLLDLFHFVLPSEREKPSWIDWTIEIFPSTHWFLLCLLPAFLIEPSSNLSWATILDIISNSCAFLLSLWRARSQQPHAALDSERGAAGPSTFWLYRCQVVSLRAAGCSDSSHRMALTRECKNPSWIAPEIEIFSSFAWLVLTLVPKHN